MSSDRLQRRPRFAACVAAALLAIAPTSLVWAADSGAPIRMSSASDPAARSLQLGSASR